MVILVLGMMRYTRSSGDDDGCDDDDDDDDALPVVLTAKSDLVRNEKVRPNALTWIIDSIVLSWYNTKVPTSMLFKHVINNGCDSTVWPFFSGGSMRSTVQDKESRGSAIVLLGRVQIYGTAEPLLSLLLLPSPIVARHEPASSSWAKSCRPNLARRANHGSGAAWVISTDTEASKVTTV